jgi:hypothetical protein
MFLVGIVFMAAGFVGMQIIPGPGGSIAQLLVVSACISGFALVVASIFTERPPK